MNRYSDKKIGCIGAGNMGGAILSRLSKKILVDNLSVIDSDKPKLDGLRKKLKINPSESIETLVKDADIIIIAVKPNDVEPVLDRFGETGDDKIIVSIAAGISIFSIEKKLGSNKKIVRVMPNTPSLIGEGMTVLSPGNKVDEESLNIIKDIFLLMGEVIVLPEKLMDAVTGLSGSGPAFVFAFIQAMTDGGVKMGIPRDKALLLAVQTVLGAAKMVKESGEDPCILRNRVASPGGTTIEGLHVLERSGFSGIIMDAIESATIKSKKLGA